MPERTEDEIVIQSGIKVILGGRKFEIRPLVVKESREWRAKAYKFVVPVSLPTKVTSTTIGKLAEALNAAMVARPDEIIDLFFNYARDLDRKEIEAVATDEEMVAALAEVIEFAFRPFTQSLVKALRIASQ